MAVFTIDKSKKSIFGMVHVRALPGTPKQQGSLQQTIAKAVAEAVLLQESGVDGIILENMHDIPYLNRVVGPEIVAGMTAVAIAVRRQCSLPIGIQILAGANEAALAVAQAADLQFIRAEGFVFSHVADEGWMDACAGPLLRYRKQIGATEIAIWTDIKKKHSAHAVTADVDLKSTVEAAEFFGSDGIIITGSSTGKAAAKTDLEAIANSTLPVIIGSGITERNLAEYWSLADGFIIGSSLKEHGYWGNELDPSRLTRMSRVVQGLRG